MKDWGTSGTELWVNLLRRFCSSLLLCRQLMFLLQPLAMRTADISALTSCYADSWCFCCGLLIAMQTAYVSAQVSCYADSWCLLWPLAMQTADVSAQVSYHADSWHFCPSLFLCRQLMFLLWSLAIRTADISAPVSCYADSWRLCSGLLLCRQLTFLLLPLAQASWHLCSILLLCRQLQPAVWPFLPASVWTDQRDSGTGQEHSPSKAKFSMIEHGHHVDEWLLPARLCACTLRFLQRYKFCAHSTKALEMRLLTTHTTWRSRSHDPTAHVRVQRIMDTLNNPTGTKKLSSKSNSVHTTKTLEMRL